ncbi:hypothetical protein LLH23_04970 [bacterium]|nr:hypothetical protein [bacterium]
MPAQPRAADPSTRLVLDGVPRVGFYYDTQEREDTRARCPEDMPFPSCLRACLEYLGDGLGCHAIRQHNPRWGIGCGYAYLMGVTGIAFQLSWADGWHPDNAATWLIGNDPGEVFRRAFAAVGYETTGVTHGDLRRDGDDNDAIARQHIIQSIRDRGRPVIANGVIGPPEECLIAGYDEGGDVLIGWNFFQHHPDWSADLEFEPNGMFRKRHWFADTWSLMLIGDRTEQPDRKRVYREALEWDLDVMRTPTRMGRHNGIAAYDVWAEHLLRDEDFATDDLAALRDRFMTEHAAVSSVAEGRWYAAIFLAQAALDSGLNPSALYAAASCCAAESDLMMRVWGIVGGLGFEEREVRQLVDGEARRRIIPLVHEARDREAEAAEHIEKALSA